MTKRYCVIFPEELFDTKLDALKYGFPIVELTGTASRCPS